MDKTEYIKSLKNVKLVLGNGFDLHCGLRTKYSDFFAINTEKQKYINIQTSFKNYMYSHNNEPDFGSLNIKEINSWDVFFAINNLQEDPIDKWNWCDIEKNILLSLKGAEKSEQSQATDMRPVIYWDTLCNYNVSTQEDEGIVNLYMQCFLQKRRNSLNTHLSFYEFLLNELKYFEKKFGNFVYSQLHDLYLENSNKSNTFLNTKYINTSIATIECLSNIDNVCQIDTFNYSYIEDEKIKPLLNHINGDRINPIFGIDTNSFESKDPRFIFTKTSRRMDLDTVEDEITKNKDFDNLIVYGHSLNEADYSYFFPMFDKLKLLDSTANGVIVFAYSVYDEEKRDKITANQRQNVVNIISAYAKSKNVSDAPRVLDSLTTQKKVIFYEIDEVYAPGYSHVEDLFDDGDKLANQANWSNQETK